jgi:hypothetical protein
MGFDAGSIKAQLEVDKTPFDRALDEAIRRIDELEAREVVVDIGADASKFNEVADEVEAREKLLERGIMVPIRADASSAEQAVKRVTTDESGLPKTVPIRFTGDTTGLDQAGRQAVQAVQRTIREIGQTVATPESQNIISRAISAAVGMGLVGTAAIEQAVLGTSIGGQSMASIAGLSRGELRGTIRGMLGAADAMSVAGFSDQLGILRAFALTKGGPNALGSPTEHAFFREMGMLGSGPGTSLVPWDLYGSGTRNQRAGSSSYPGSGWDPSFAGMRQMFSDQGLIRDPQKGFSPMGVLRYLQDSRPGMALSGGLSSLWSGLGSSTAVPLLGSMPMAGALALGIGSAGIVSALGMAAGVAAGGIISGLGIGIPGLAAGAYGGYTAFQRVNSARNAASTLQSTLANLRASGLGPGSAQWTQALTRYKDATGNPAVDKAAAALSRLAAAATAVTHGMTKGWYPVLTQAFNAGTKFLKQPAIHSFLMNSNRGMQDFVRGTAAAMSDPQTRHDFTVFSQNVRPLMDKVGTGVGRLAQGGLSFIADFAPMAQVLASMFERWATGVDKFFAHFKLGKGTIDLVVGVLHDLGSIIGSVVGIVGKLVVAFAPIGKILLDIISYVVKAVAWIMKMIPPQVLTVILGAALVILTAIWLLFMANPVTLIILGIIAVGVAIYALATHWKQVWTDIKNWAVDAWQAIDNEVIHPIMRAWSAVSTSISGAAKTAWRDVKQWAVDAWQAIDNNVFHPIASAWHTVVTVITTAWSTAWGAVKGVILAVWNWIKTNIVNPIKSVLSTMWNGLVSGVRTAVGLAVTAFGPLINIIHTILSALGIIGNSKGGLTGGGHMPHYGPPLPVPPGTPIIRGGGPGPPNPAPGGTTGHALGQTTIHIHVDARGSTSAAELTAAAQRGVNAALRAAMNRGALRPA